MLDFATTDFSKAEDISENQLAPHGTLVKLHIKDISDAKKNTNGKGYFVATLEVMEGPFASKELKENFYLDGKPFALEKTKLFVRYALENSIQAHEKGDDAYRIKTPKALMTGTIVAKLGVKGFFGDKGDWIHTNEVLSFATPRPDSSTFKAYQAYVNGEQPFQTDYKPAKPANGGGGYVSGGDFGEPPAGHPAASSDPYGF